MPFLWPLALLFYLEHTAILLCFHPVDEQLNHAHSCSTAVAIKWHGNDVCITGTGLQELINQHALVYLVVLMFHRGYTVLSMHGSTLRCADEGSLEYALESIISTTARSHTGRGCSQELQQPDCNTCSQELHAHLITA